MDASKHFEISFTVTPPKQKYLPKLKAICEEFGVIPKINENHNGTQYSFVFRDEEQYDTFNRALKEISEIYL